MYQIFQKSYLKPEICIDDVPAPNLHPQGILVQTYFSLISPGTERAAISFARKSLIGKVFSQSERVNLLVRKMRQNGIFPTLQLAKRKLEVPVPLGYSASGIVVAVGEEVKDICIGQRVACCGSQFANHAEFLYIPQNLFVPLPANLSYEEGAFVALGAIALHGVRLASIALGETVVVIGLGLVGQLAVQLAKANGATVIGIDLDAERLEKARSLGAAAAFNRFDNNLISQVYSLTQGKGADVVLIAAATPSDDPVFLAGELARDKGRIVAIGDVGMRLPRKIYYEKELSFIVSRSYGPGRYDDAYEKEGQSYPSAYVRWTERDNMACFLKLVAEGQVRLEPLVSGKYPMHEAAKAYELLISPERKQSQVLGILIQYPASQEESKVMDTSPTEKIFLANAIKRSVDGCLGLGIIGTGDFVRSVMLPIFSKHPLIKLRGIVSNNGLHSKILATQYRFSYCASELSALVSDPDCQVVYIATRHDSHCAIIKEALKAGKHVLVEKPLATTPSELQQCIDALLACPGQHFMVGFNRRFACATQKLKQVFETQNLSQEPMSIFYRVHAGPVPANSWVHEHGGRVVGEICHFVDWIIYITGSHPVEVRVHQLGESPNPDLIIHLMLKNGSQATIQYVTRTSSARGKEYIELYASGLSCQIDDFRTLKIADINGKAMVDERYRKNVKGHASEVALFLNQIKQGGEPIISIQDLIATTLTTFSISEGIYLGAGVSVPPVSEWLNPA